MRVFDLIGDVYGQRAGTRVAAIGSCRVLDPFEALANVGRAVRVWANASSATHTFGEAQQAIRFTRGEIDIPDRLRPFVFQPPRQASLSSADRRILDTVDTVFVEVCELFQIVHEQYYFQVNHLYSEFVSKYGGPLLPWYRAFSLREPITDEIVANALEKLADRSADERAFIEAVLRNTRIELLDVKRATAALGEVMFDRGKNWVVVSHFVVPGMSGTQMKDRLELVEILRQATAHHGVTMFDPSVVLQRFGRESVLASEGKDIYHYNADFNEVVGDWLLRAADLAKGAAMDGPQTARADHTSPTDTAAEWINGKLISLHQSRVATLGVDESGLYAHYKGLLDSRQIVAPWVASLAHLIVSLLPRFDRYDVLRAGLGELAFVLAATGLRTAAFEPNPRRFAAMVAGLEKLAADDALLARRLVVGPAGIPDVPKHHRTLAIAHHFIGISPEQQDQVLAQLSLYDALLIDPRIFLFPRNTDEERDAIVDVVRALGFTQVREFPKLGIVYCAKPPHLSELPSLEKTSDTAATVAQDADSRSASEADGVTLLNVATSAQTVDRANEVRAWGLVGPFVLNGGGGWTCSLPEELHSRTDNNENPYQSPLRLLEDGRELGVGHDRHEIIRSVGAGHYSFWGDMLYFSTSDGSDPNTNKRHYKAILADREAVICLKK